MLKLKRIFITGGKGFIGSHIVARLLEQNKDLEAYLLTRGSEEEAYTKMQKTFSIIAPDLVNCPRVYMVSGDITNNVNLGIKTKLPNFNEVWHLAAFLGFKQSDADIAYKSNVKGTENVLAFAKAHQAKKVHVMGTAFSRGKKQGLILENDPYQDYGFNNSYENTKYKARTIALEWGIENNIPVLIYEPTIVTGDYSTGFTLNFKGYYTIAENFVNFKQKAIKRLENNDQRLKDWGVHYDGSYLTLPIRFFCKLNAPINLIPVNFLADMVCRISEIGKPGIYHIVNPNPPSFWFLFTASLDILKIKGFTLVEEIPKDLTSLERLINQANALYSGYFSTSQFFDYANTMAVLGSMPEMSITKDYLKKILAYALETDFGKNFRGWD